MNKEQLKELLNKMGRHVPLSIIEAYLKMPKNTLQKALSEKEKQQRNLPKKWVKPLSDFVNFKQYITMDSKIKDPVKAPTEKLIIEEEPEKTTGLSSFQIYQRKKLGLK